MDIPYSMEFNLCIYSIVLLSLYTLLTSTQYMLGRVCLWLMRLLVMVRVRAVKGEKYRVLYKNTQQLKFKYKYFSSLSSFLAHNSSNHTVILKVFWLSFCRSKTTSLLDILGSTRLQYVLTGICPSAREANRRRNPSARYIELPNRTEQLNKRGKAKRRIYCKSTAPHRRAQQ